MTKSEIKNIFKNESTSKTPQNNCKEITIENCEPGYVIDACVLIDCSNEKILCRVLKNLPKRKFYVSSEIKKEFLKSQKYCKNTGKSSKTTLKDFNELINKLENYGLKIYSINITDEIKSDSNKLFKEYKKYHKLIDGNRIFHYPDNIHLNLANKTKSELITNDGDFLYFCKVNHFKCIDFQHFACECMNIAHLPYNYQLHKSKNRGSQYGL